jgi:hypothetical protein
VSVRLLSFVNHIAPHDGIEEDIDRALAWGVDAIVAQGTGTDWGAYWLGSGRQIDTGNFKENVRPYLRAAVANDIPFVLSVGIAGADVHLAECLTRLDELTAEEGWTLDLGVIESEIDRGWLSQTVREGRVARAAYDVPDLSPVLTEVDVDEAVRVVGLVGAEPIAELLQSGVQGVVTGRSVDIALYMALPLARGIPYAVAAHAAKVVECGGLALEPGDPGCCMWVEIDEDGFEVRSPDPRRRATCSGIASHGFYERADPWREANPGGWLDLSCARFEATEHGVRSTGARWESGDYTVLIEGAKLLGFRSVVVMGVREPALLAGMDAWIESMHRDVAASGRFSHLKPGTDYTITVRVYGRDGVLGPLEPHDHVTGHEAGVVLDVVAPTQELADQLAYFAFIRLYIGPYEGRKTTAGNTAVPFMPVTLPAGEVYGFNIYHVLPLEHPGEPFRTRRLSLPSSGGGA